MPVVLPSSLSAEGRGSCQRQLIDAEVRLREGRCQSALDELRKLLFVKSRLVTYKDRNVRHQAANTRTRTLIARNEAKIKFQAMKFQTSWSALRVLAGGDETKLRWPALKHEHIRCMEDPDTTKKKEVRRVRGVENRREDAMNKADEDEENADGDKVVSCEGYRTMSWIWLDAVGGDSASGAEMDVGACHQL